MKILSKNKREAAIEAIRGGHVTDLLIHSSEAIQRYENDNIVDLSELVKSYAIAVSEVRCTSGCSDKNSCDEVIRSLHEIYLNSDEWRVRLIARSTLDQVIEAGMSDA